MKIRIFALAKELDMDSKVLIDYCAKAGIIIKNSPLAGISPDERDRVMEIIRSSGSAAPASKKPEVLAPSRDVQAAELEGKVRSIRNMAPRPQPSRFSRPEDAARAADGSAGDSGSSEDSAPVAVEEPPVETARPAAETRSAPATEPVTEGPRIPGPLGPLNRMRDDRSRESKSSASRAAAAAAAEATSAASTSAAATGAVAPTVAVTSPVTEPADGVESVDVPPTAVAEINPEPAAEAPEAAPVPATDRPASAKPLTPDHYVSPHGSTRSMRSMTMQPRGTEGTAPKDLGKRPANKGKDQSGPRIAVMPTFNGPKIAPGKPEPAAQVPDVRFPTDVISAKGGLGKFIAENKKEQARRSDDDAAEASRGKESRRGDRNAISIEESRVMRARNRKVTPTSGDDEEESSSRPSHKYPRRRVAVPQQPHLKTSAEIEQPINVRSLSEAIGRPAKQLLKLLFDRGEMATINSSLEEELAIELAMEVGVDLTIHKARDMEDDLLEMLTEADPPERLKLRPPIITILGHVDHGKTTLVDRIRSANVAASEFGGITQHIAAYQVERNGQKLTFVDTPGHAAFGEMRARGANVTDLVVLVVAANDGVMPQTVECIAHARAAGVPLVVAMNKVDLPDRNEQRVLQDLAAQNVLATEWGGDIELVRTSGLTGAGVNELLDTLLLTAELSEYKADPDRPAQGTCLEAFRDEGRGPLAWFIVQRGTLRVGDTVLCGEAYGRIRALYNEFDQELTEAPPSSPVKIAGLDIVPAPGDRFLVIDDMDVVRAAAEERRALGRATLLASRGGRRTLEDVLNAAREGAIQDLNLIVKADTPGSLEALRSELRKFEHPEVRVKLLHEGVGGVNESDVYLASASDAIIIAFHVIEEDRAKELAQQEGVEVRRYNIIYQVIDDIRSTLEGMLKPAIKEVVTGRAIVLRTFNISRFGTVAGCRVLNGTIDRSSKIHVIREQKILNDYGIASLKREKDDAKEVREGMECGIRLENFNDVKEGDLFEAYKIEEVRRTLD